MDTLWSKEVFARNLKMYMERAGKTQKEVAEIIGVSAPTFNDWVKAKKYPRIDKIERLAAYFGILKSDLIEDKGRNNIPFPAIDYEKYGLRPIKTKKIPMLGAIACGEPIYASEDFETYVEVSSDLDADFCLTAKGDSMINARIFDGDIVFIKIQQDVENGEIAAVVINDDATLKRVYKYKNRIELRAENPLFQPLEFEREQLDQIHILGKAVAFQSVVR